MKSTSFILLLLLSILSFSCQKDPFTEDPSKLKDLSKSDFIESTMGGTIELNGGTSITIPSGALQENEEIKISTYTPTVENINKDGLDAFSSTIAFSQIIRLEPSGLTFDKPVRVEIPIVQSWIPDWVSDDMLVGLIISGEDVDSLPITIDRSKNIAFVETSHFSDLVISMKKNSNVKISNAKVTADASKEKLNFTFDLDLLDNAGSTITQSVFKMDHLDWQGLTETYSFYKISLFENGRLWTDKLIREVYMLKLHSDCEDLRIVDCENYQADDLKDRLETYEKKKKKREFDEIIKMGSLYVDNDNFIGRYVLVRYDGDGNLIGSITKSGSNQTGLNNQKALEYITGFDKQGLPIDIIELSELEDEGEYQIKVDVLIEGSKSGFHGESKKSNKFTLDDLGSALDVTNAPQAIITSPPNHSEYYFGETINLSGYGQDKEDGRITSGLEWSYTPQGGGAGVIVAGNSVNNIPVGIFRLYLTVTDRSELTGTTWHQITIKNNEPVVNIDTPDDGDEFYIGDQISFKGTITDKEDVTPVASRVTWKSNLQGIIKTGQTQFSSSSLQFGTHKISLEYTDGHGVKRDDEVTIEIGSKKPVVTIHGPTNNSTWEFGTIIGFRGSATDPEGNLDESSYRWYSSIDGEIEKGTGEKDFGYSGLSKGTHQITLKAKDKEGMEGEDSHTIIITDEENHSPVARLQVSPSSGTTETTFAFDASSSTDAEDALSSLQFRWDFNNDWDWETSWSSTPSVNRTFSEAGDYKIWVEVKDTKGATSKASVDIVVSDDGDPLERPTNVYAGDWDRGFGVYWADNSNEETGFKVYRAVNSTNNFILMGQTGANAQFLVDNDYNPANYYTYKVQAFTSNQESELSEMAIVPKRPTGLSASGGSNSITISWTYPSSSQLERVYIERSQNPSSGFVAIDWISEPATNYVDQSVAKDVNYYYRIQGYWGSNNADHASITIPTDVIGPFKVSGGGTGGDGEFTYEGRTYAYKTIGTQTWMIENLAYLPSVSPSSSGSDTSPYYYVYEYEGSSVSAAKGTANYTTYGVLYNWEAAKAACPQGWRLPSDEDWTVLTNYLGNDAGKKMKSISGWYNEGNGDNSSGFNALPGGSRDCDGGFLGLGDFAYFWSSAEDGSSYAWARCLGCTSDGVGRNYDDRRGGFSVRCLKN